MKLADAFGVQIELAGGPIPSGARPADDDVLDIVRAVGRVEVVLLLRAQRSGPIRLSARSKGDFDVQELARGFGGGGHRRAAGATLEGPLDAACEGLVAAALNQMGVAPVVAGPKGVRT